MIARQIETWLERVSENNKIIHLFGLRQTGKSTLFNHLRKTKYPNALYYPLHDFVTLRRYEGQPEKWVLEIEKALADRSSLEKLHVFVDEVQKIPDFFQGLQGLYEEHREKVKFWIWGSSARVLKRKRAETLAGRSLHKTLWPLSQSELLKKPSPIPCLFNPDQLMKDIAIEEPRDYTQQLSHLFQQTLLPEPHLLKNPQDVDDLLTSYQATYVENEIRWENLVENIGLFERFLALAANEDTQIVNYSAKAKVLDVSYHTIKSYYWILEDTFVCKEIPAYSKSFRVQTAKSPKIYFTDTGLARFIVGERGLPHEGTQTFGKLIEGFVVNEILKQIEYHSLPWKLSYLRTKTGMEVDLIISAGKERIAVEIKSSQKIAPSDYKPILTLMEMDKEIKYGVVFSRQSAPFQLAPKIYNFPIWNL